MKTPGIYCLKLALLIAVSSISSSTLADEQIQVAGCQADNALNDSMHTNKNTIGNIAINIHPIFDETNPAENNWLFRTVNYLHINTHESVIKNDLLVSPGDAYDDKLLAESERILRTRRYLNTASVKAQPGCGSSIPVQVDVREVWTLVPELSFSHSGGSSNYGFGLHDSNFLGFGKTVNLTHTTTAQRTGNLFEYYDPNTGIYDSNFLLQYANNSDGVQKSVSLIRPFAALSTEWTSGISYDNYDREDRLYNAGKEVDRFAHSNVNQSLFYGIKLDTSIRESIHRIIIGYTTWQDSFLTAAVPASTNIIPDGREFNYPWIEYQHIHDGFIKAYNIQQINRVEDINLGAQIRFRIGYATSPFAIYDNSYVISSEYSQAFALSDQQLIFADLTADGHYGNSQFYDSLIKANASYHWQDFTRGQFFVELTAARGIRLFKDLPLELGGDIGSRGDAGLRGYPAFYQAGDHLQLISIEQRFFGEKEWLSLFHMGGAIFYDEGRVWGESAVPQSQSTWLRDVGIGLRISGTRIGNSEEGAHNIVHIDIASPLDGGKNISKVQWILKVKKSF